MEHHWNNGGSSNGMIKPPAFLATRLEDNSPLNLYCYNYDDNVHHQGSCLEPVEAQQGLMMLEAVHRHNNVESSNNNNLHETGLMDSKSITFGNVHHHHHDMKKKRLSDEQLDALERSFKEDIKLDPERKMKLSRELGMQPRQIAVWFQNRRARWKNKQLERMYDALKLDFDVVSREKLTLQEEVAKLKGILRERLMASSEEDAKNSLLALSKKQTVVVAGEVMTASDQFNGANLGLEYVNSQPLLLTPNYWSAHQQLPHYPY